MLRTTLSLLLLFVLSSLGVAQVAQTKNVDTRCGKFVTLRQGQPGGDPLTDIDTVRVLQVLENFDLNKDTFIPKEERIEAIQRFSTFNLTAGVPRCTIVDAFASDRSLEKYVGAYFFDYLDRNGDMLLKLEDYDEPSDVLIQRVDKNGDGNLSVCEHFDATMRGLQIAENQVYDHEIKYRAIVDKFKKPVVFPNSAGAACDSIIVIVGVYLFQLLTTLI